MTMRCFLFGWMRLYLCKMFARWVYNNTNARDDTTMRCFLFGWMRLYLCKMFARWVYNNTNARDDMTMRCFLFGWMRLYLCKMFARCVYNSRRQLTPNFGRISISENSSNVWTTKCRSNIWRILRNGDSSSRVPLLPICWTISISNISTNISTCIYGLRFGRNVRNGDCPKMGRSGTRLDSSKIRGELPTAGLQYCRAPKRCPTFLSDDWSQNVKILKNAFFAPFVHRVSGSSTRAPMHKGRKKSIFFDTLTFWVQSSDEKVGHRFGERL